MENGTWVSGEKTPDWNGELNPGPLEIGFDTYFGVPVVNSHPPFVYIEDHQIKGHDPDDPIVFGGPSNTEAGRDSSSTSVFGGPGNTESHPEKFDTGSVGGARAAHALYKDEEVCTTLTNRAVDWIRSHKEDPFFLYFPTTNIHHPFTPHDQFKGTSDCGPYGDSIHELDWAVGRILDTLDELKLRDNTLVIFTSDNGGMLNEGGKVAWEAGHRINGDLLGFKFDAWEGGHRVPFLARWPGHITPGSRSDQLVSSVDMLATIAAILGYKLEDDEGVDSFNLLPALIGEPREPIRDHFLIAPRSPDHHSLRKGKWVYISNQGAGGFDTDTEGSYNWRKWHALTGQVNSDLKRNGEIKEGAPPAQLYDLERDLFQRHNCYRDHPEVVQQLKSLLERYQKEGRSAPAR